MRLDFEIRWSGCFWALAWIAAFIVCLLGFLWGLRGLVAWGCS